MKRYKRLIRTILSYVECHGNEEGGLAPPEVSGFTPVQVQYHIKLCEQAGYIETQSGYPRSLTWSGHDALDAMRAEES